MAPAREGGEARGQQGKRDCARERDREVRACVRACVRGVSKRSAVVRGTMTRAPRDFSPTATDAAVSVFRHGCEFVGTWSFQILHAYLGRWQTPFEGMCMCSNESSATSIMIMPHHLRKRNLDLQGLDKPVEVTLCRVLDRSCSRCKLEAASARWHVHKVCAGKPAFGLF